LADVCFEGEREIESRLAGIEANVMGARWIG
jgi:hypothetical protein